jgi:hypothetical protein
MRRCASRSHFLGLQRQTQQLVKNWQLLNYNDKIKRIRNTITCCNCLLPQISISSFCMVGDRYLPFGGLFCKWVVKIWSVSAL